MFSSYHLYQNKVNKLYMAFSKSTLCHSEGAFFRDRRVSNWLSRDASGQKAPLSMTYPLLSSDKEKAIINSIARKLFRKS